MLAHGTRVRSKFETDPVRLSRHQVRPRGEGQPPEVVHPADVALIDPRGVEDPPIVLGAGVQLLPYIAGQEPVLEPTLFRARGPRELVPGMRDLQGRASLEDP